MGKRNCFFNPNFQRIAKQLQNNNKVVVGKDRQEKKVSSNHMCADICLIKPIFEIKFDYFPLILLNLSKFLKT